MVELKHTGTPWEEIMAAAHRLESAARDGQVLPGDGARFVLMVLDFDLSLHRVKLYRPSPDSEPAR
jgi:hypothetical protein